MREILFRGKRVDDGKWVNGYFVYDESGQITEENTAYIYYLNTHTCGWDLIPFKVDPKTVGQYTGLTDKNGKKIFEGDIVKADGYIFTVKFDKCGGVANDDNFGYMGFYFEGFDEITKKCMDLGLRKDICYFVNREVIGNIHDNPELLEKGGDRE